MGDEVFPSEWQLYVGHAGPTGWVWLTAEWGALTPIIPSPQGLHVLGRKVLIGGWVQLHMQAFLETRLDGGAKTLELSDL